MALLHFSPSYNLPDTRIYTMNGLIKLLAPKFKQGWKYYFTQCGDSVVVVPAANPTGIRSSVLLSLCTAAVAIRKLSATPINGFSSKRNL